MVATVGTSVYLNPVIFAFEKKCFYANGRWWVWYSPSVTSFGWETSIDGIDWTGAFTSYGAFLCNKLDIWYDEANNKICLVRCVGTSSSHVYYRQGTANSDGTITWDSDEVQVDVTASQYACTKVIKDSNGYPWVSVTDQTNGYLQVYKATTTSGSAWGSPTNLWTGVGTSHDIAIVPLTNGRLLAIHTFAGATIKSKLYDGSSWWNEVTATTSNLRTKDYFDLVADGDNAHLVFEKITSLDIIYVKYVYGTGWGSEETVESGTVAQNHPTISFKSTDKVRVYYFLSQTTIKYRDRDEGSWQTAVTISSSESTMTCLSSSYKPVSSNICVTWKNGAASPYDVKIETYTLGPPPPPSAGLLVQVM
jgi:hypothetical protein